jgi:lysophospholipase L1-like esterase
MIYKNDWANKNKYYLANKELINQPNSNNSIVFIGDSITEFWYDKDPIFFKSNHFVNRGISGQTTNQILYRFPDDVIVLKPKSVIILAGINDIAENSGPITLEAIFENIVSMIQLSQQNNINVILCSILPANHFYWNLNVKPADKIISLNELIHSYSIRNAIPYVNYYEKMVDSDKGLSINFSKDGVHPNIEGYNLMKSILLKLI